jgi:hypothetical protein
MSRKGEKAPFLLTTKRLDGAPGFVSGQTGFTADRRLEWAMRELSVWGGRILFVTTPLLIKITAHRLCSPSETPEGRTGL